MIATGFAWYVGTYEATDDPILARVAYGFQGWYDALLAWLVLAYPTGHLRPMASRVVIALFLGLLATRSIVRLAAFRQSIDYDFGDPAEVDRFVSDQSFRDAADALFRIGIAAVAVAVIVLVVYRLRTETAIGRRVAGPILLGGFGFALAIVVETIAPRIVELRGALVRLGHRAGSDVDHGCGHPVAFLVGLGRIVLARGPSLISSSAWEVRSRYRRPPRSRRPGLGDPSLEIAYPVDERAVRDRRPEPSVALPEDGRTGR